MIKKYLIEIIALIGIAFIISGCTNSSDTATTNNDEILMSKAPAAETIEVVHFHGTQQCWSCTTVGKLALKTITDKFPEQYKNGTITFKDINGELSENRDIVAKYQARGSSLFINSITNDQDNIQEDVNVWRYVNNEDQFINYFEKKLNTLLGK